MFSKIPKLFLLSSVEPNQGPWWLQALLAIANSAPDVTDMLLDPHKAAIVRIVLMMAAWLLGAWLKRKSGSKPAS